MVFVICRKTVNLSRFVNNKVLGMERVNTRKLLDKYSNQEYYGQFVQAGFTRVQQVFIYFTPLMG